MQISGRTLLPAILCLLTICASSPGQSTRIAANADLRVRTRLSDHRAPWAIDANDAGPVAAGFTLEHLTLMLTRPPAVEAAFQQLLVDQQNPGSPRFHQWITPQQQAELYGVPEAESAPVAAWLTSQGLRVDSISPNRVFINFSGSATSVGNALQVEFHNFNRRDGLQYAATAEPSIPAAFASVIQSFTGLSEERHATPHTLLAPRPLARQAAPDYTIATGVNWIAPADFAKIYDLTPAFNAGITGTGQHVGIIAASRVATTDITLFQGIAGLPPALPVAYLVPGSTDPGTTSNGNQGEATLDTDRVLGTAPYATADLILISTLTDSLIQLGLQYAVSTLNEPIINMSFGRCEASGTISSYQSFNSIFAQAAAQGISLFVSSGDSDAAGCETAGGTFSLFYSQLSINVLCASPYVTCVGGTQFSDTASPATYWSTTNTTGELSALSYIPEGAWNEPSYVSSGVTSYVVLGTSGGASAFVSKPIWQTGTGVPADGARDTPDVSFSSSGHNAYFACLAYSGADCVKYITGFSGTSAAAPSMAAITALVNQRTGTRQGVFNAALYTLAANTANGVFHDATPATSGTTCVLTVASTCNNTTPGVSGLTGGATGYPLTTGYDLATGLGSIDVSNLLIAIAGSLSETFAVTATAPPTVTAGTPTTFTGTFTSSNGFTGSIAPSCTIAANFSGSTVLPTCSSSSTISLNAAIKSTTATFTVATTQRSAATIPSLIPRAAVVFACLLLFLPTRRRFSRSISLAWLLATSLLTLSGCSSKSASSAATGSTAGSYTVTVGGTGNGTTVTTTVQLTLQ